MDALDFSRDPVIQYNQNCVIRELIKCYCGFMETNLITRTPIASGLWGCGMFKGDYRLKTIIQLIAASECERDLVLCKIDHNLRKELNEFYHQIKSLDCNVGHLYKAIISCERNKLLCQYNLFEYTIQYVRDLLKVPNQYY